MQSKPRILLAWELGGGLGHVTKFMVLAERLQAQGYELWAACQNLADAEITLGRLGVRLVPAPIWNGGPGNVPEPINYAGILARKGWLDADGLAGMARGWRNLVDAIAPRLIVANHAPGMLLGLRDCDTPILYIDTPFGIPPLASPFPNMRYWQGEELLPMMHAVEEQVLATANRVLASMGSSNLPHLCDLFQGVETCLLGLPELDHYPEREPAEYYGPLYAEDWGAAPIWPAGEGKHVFVYLDSAHALFAPLLDHLAGLSCRVLVFSSRLPDAAVSGKPNIVLHNRPLRMSQVLVKAELVVNHAGYGVSNQALLAGVPLLMLPNHLEQAMLAVRVGELRAGKVLPNDARLIGGPLRQALADTACARQAKDFAARHAECSLASTLDRLVERCVARVELAA
jgi:UDP:flavonoid glycosyltransferase YjiC (YdhE family)